ncbi:hypothetical protein AMJ57_03680 [Parcubacteria bacterium SG8_24]|nr:MAG: hypothetical protein AMJ57_03680 [Parcubacteria bacterium SG8_24]
MGLGVVFFDIMMNALLCFTALFILAYVQIRPESEDESALATEGKFVVVMEWPNQSEDDVDLYVQDPYGNIAYFQSRGVGLMHLEHDDLGARNDSITTASGDIRVERNEERVIIRGIVPGEYVVNVHMYTKRDPGETPVTVRLYRLLGQDTEVMKRERTLRMNGDERTAFRFTLDPEGMISKINELEKTLAGPLVNRLREGVP